jgi:hypothetical protein
LLDVLGWYIAEIFQGNRGAVSVGATFQRFSYGSVFIGQNNSRGGIVCFSVRANFFGCYCSVQREKEVSCLLDHICAQV